jgi:tRNA 2-thiouridine synthesizing protein A
LKTMSSSVEELKSIASPVVVDARGVSCPGPILAAKRQIAGVTVGNVMEVMATDSGTLKDIPAWCKKMGHDFLGSFEEAGSIHLFLRKAK